MSTYSNKNKVLVAGATGLIGSNLVNQLVEEGYDVRGTLHDNEPSMPNPSVEYVKADLTSLELILFPYLYIDKKWNDTGMGKIAGRLTGRPAGWLAGWPARLAGSAGLAWLACLTGWVG